MKDCLGREIKTGDVVAYTSNDGGPCLCVAEVLGSAKSDPEEKVRVRVFRSESHRFTYGRKRSVWKDGKFEVVVTREPGVPYDATIGMSSRVIIVGEDVSSYKVTR